VRSVGYRRTRGGAASVGARYDSFTGWLPRRPAFARVGGARPLAVAHSGPFYSDSPIVVHTSAAHWCTFVPLAAPPRPS
jgi:hypothetical protein